MKAPMMSIPGAAATEIPTDDSGDVSIENIQELDDRKKYYHSMATEKITITFRSVVIWSIFINLLVVSLIQSQCKHRFLLAI